MNSSVSIVLNGYKRPEYLKDQVDHINKQTIQPKEILYWQNTLPNVDYDNDTSNKLISSYSNKNFGVWSRFAYALNCQSEYVCIFDDDTVPGEMWLQNCINTYEKYTGLLGTIGVIFGQSGYENGDYRRVGWDNPNEETQEVDIVGHSWFFHRDLLSVFWRELPKIDQIMYVGEDIHFSHMIQKYTKYKTYVPPHPANDKRLWGSLKGWQLGGDNKATAAIYSGEMIKYINMKRKNGFKILEDYK